MPVSTTSSQQAVYTQTALSQLPRILGLCDRDPQSKTFGCCDRYYWHYRLLDLPNARFQEVCWLLALLYSQPVDPAYHQNPQVLSWLSGMIGFWLKKRHGDGSVDEVYPFERSFCATSFSTLAVTESMILADLKTDPAVLQKTGTWLSTHQNPALSNQQAASLVALHNIAELVNNEKLRKAATNRKQELLNSQHPSGYFPEYGGMDVGYLTITLSLLALYVKKTDNADVREAAEKVVAFLEPLIDENGQYDYQNTSRKTQYIYPSGLAYFAPHLLERHTKGLKNNTVVSPAWMDDRYCIALATDYLLC